MNVMFTEEKTTFKEKNTIPTAKHGGAQRVGVALSRLEHGVPNLRRAQWNQKIIKAFWRETYDPVSQSQFIGPPTG